MEQRQQTTRLVAERDVQCLYLRERIDFDWLRSQVELLPPLKQDEAQNVIYEDWAEIRGGSEVPPSQRPKSRISLLLDKWLRFR